MTDSAFNLDRLAAETAQDIVSGVDRQEAKDLERLVNKALGVLQEHGVYALMLFLFSRSGSEDEMARKIRPCLHQALRKLPAFGGMSIQDDLKSSLEFYTKHVLGNLDTLLLVRDLYEQILIYTRYGAKAIGR